MPDDGGESDNDPNADAEDNEGDNSADVDIHGGGVADADFAMWTSLTVAPTCRTVPILLSTKIEWVVINLDPVDSLSTKSEAMVGTVLTRIMAVLVLLFLTTSWTAK